MLHYVSENHLKNSSQPNTVAGSTQPDKTSDRLSGSHVLKHQQVI